MAYSETLAERIRDAMATVRKVEEKKMFGGLAFMVDGKMCVTTSKDRIMCRVDPDLHDDLIAKPGCSTVLMRGRPYRGYIHVNEKMLKSKQDLQFWIDLALDFNKRAKASK